MRDNGYLYENGGEKEQEVERRILVGAQSPGRTDWQCGTEKN